MIFAEQVFKINLFPHKAADCRKSGFVGFIYVANRFQLRFAGVLSRFAIFENIGDRGISIERQLVLIVVGKISVNRREIFLQQSRVARCNILPFKQKMPAIFDYVVNGEVQKPHVRDIARLLRIEKCRA